MHPADPSGSPTPADLADLARRHRQVPVGQQVTVSVPATSANLGPGFDSLGLALELRDEVTVTTVEHGFTAQVSGEGAGSLPDDGRHLIISTLRAELARAGWDLPGLSLQATNRIPHGRGLGSSATALVTAVLLAQQLLPEQERMSPEALLDRACALEGHPDNVAPALQGGLAVSWASESGYRSVRLEPHEDVRAVVAVPAEPLSTETARGLLPETVPHADAAANAGRAALLVHALTQDPALLLEATQDLLHQQYRAPAMPESVDLVHALRGQGHPGVVSGAGPTVLAFAVGEQGARQVRDAVEQGLQGSGQDWRVRILPLDRTGARVVSHP